MLPCFSKRSSFAFLLATCTALSTGCGQGLEEEGAATPPGSAPYVWDEFGELESELTGTRAEVIDFARTWIGTPYVRGGCTRDGIDCSCFTKRVFEKFGKSLPDDPELQWNHGTRVDRADLRKGDLVFFKEGGANYITHVGIYSGNGYILHASTYFDKVVEKEMRYVDGYFGARSLF